MSSPSAAPDELGPLCAELNDPARETIRLAWKYFEEHGAWPTFGTIEKALIRALPPRTNLVMALHQTPRWTGWLGSPGHPSPITVMLLALAACVGNEAGPVLKKFWRAFVLARSLHDRTTDDQFSEITSEQLQAAETSGGLGLSELETRQVHTLLQSEGLLNNGNHSGPADPYHWRFNIANRIYDFRESTSLSSYLRIRRDEEVARTSTVGVGRAQSMPPGAATYAKRSRGRVSAHAPQGKGGVNPRPTGRGQRSAVPQETVDQVLFLSNHRCCVCRKRGKAVQTHHLDGDRTNHTLDNLAPLCLECHNRTLLKGGFGRRLTEGEIRLFRDEWYAIASAKRGNVAGGDRTKAKDATKLDETAVAYLESLKSTVDRITLELNNAYQADRPTTLDMTDYLSEFDRSQLLMSQDFASECDDCYVAALQLNAALRKEPRRARAVNDRHEKFMTASRRLRGSIVREVRQRRGLS